MIVFRISREEWQRFRSLCGDILALYLTVAVFALFWILTP